MAKMEEISNDVANCEATKISDITRLEAARGKSWEMIYRTVLRDDDKRFIVQALGQKKSTADEFNIRNPPPSTNQFERVRINLFEMQSGV